MRTVIYGPGGFDPSRPDHNIIDVADDGQPEPDTATPTIDAATAVTLGVALAVEAGVSPERAQEIVADVTGVAAPPLPDAWTEQA